LVDNEESSQKRRSGKSPDRQTTPPALGEYLAPFGLEPASKFALDSRRRSGPRLGMIEQFLQEVGVGTI
jgi:hypothetical protein